MSKPIKKPVIPPVDKGEIDKSVSVCLLYIIELLEAIAESQGIIFEEPD